MHSGAIMLTLTDFYADISSAELDRYLSSQLVSTKYLETFNNEVPPLHRSCFYSMMVWLIVCPSINPRHD